MKNLMCALLFISCGSSYAQLEDYVTGYADTVFNTKSLIETITITDYSGDPTGVAEYTYYDSDTLKSMMYQDEQGYRHHEYNEQGHCIFNHVDHYKSLHDFRYFAYEYAENGQIIGLSHYDSTQSLAYIQQFEYNEFGKLKIASAYNQEGDLINYSTHLYNDEQAPISSKGYNKEGVLIERYTAASENEDGMAHNFRYTYNSQNELIQINFVFINENGDYDKISFIEFEHEEGELKKYRTAGQEFEKVKKKNKEELLFQEYYFVLEWNKLE